MSKWWLRGSVPAFLGLLLLLAAGSPGLAQAHRGNPSFQSVVEQSWNSWDHEHTGRLTARQINKLLSDPTITGSQAAALATIHLYLRDQHPHKTFVTHAFLLAHPAGASPSPRHLEERRSLALQSGGKEPFSFSETYHEARNTIAGATRQLYAHGGPRLETISQGDLGDCFLVSAIGAAVQRNPQLIQAMIHTAADGGQDVQFLTGRKVHVAPLTDAELALLSDSGKTGLWLNILEKTFGQMSGKQDPRTRNKLAVDILDQGGDSSDVLPLLTGHRAATFAIRHGTGDKKPAPSGQKLLAVMDRVRHLLHQAFAEHRLVCAGTDSSTPPPGMVEDHAYAILSCRGDVVGVWNPWGDDFTPKGQPGIEHGYPTRHGRFFMPLRDFVKVFEEIYYETGEPPPSGRGVRGR